MRVDENLMKVDEPAMTVHRNLRPPGFAVFSDCFLSVFFRVRGWHLKLWTRMGKFYTARYSGRGYEKGNMGKTFGYYENWKVEKYTAS